METQICGKVTEVYSRCVGYHRPTSLWNKGKKSEYEERRPYILRKLKPIREPRLSTVRALQVYKGAVI
jgi:hypothetical protein